MNLPSNKCEICGKSRCRYIDHTDCRKKREAMRATLKANNHYENRAAKISATLKAKLAAHSKEFIITGVASNWLKTQPIAVLSELSKQRTEYIAEVNSRYNSCL